MTGRLLSAPAACGRMRLILQSLAVLLAMGCAPGTSDRQPFRSASQTELETDPLLSLTFEGATPRPLFRIGGDAGPYGNEATVARTWEFHGGAVDTAAVLAKVRSLGLTFDRVTCFLDGKTIAVGLRGIPPDVGAQVYVTVDEALEAVEIELVGQPALVSVTTSTPAFTGCSDRVMKAAR